MSNFICPTCGFNNIDCGKAGYKTDREIELEKKLEVAVKALEDLKNLEFKESIIKQQWGVYHQMINRVDEALAKIKEIK